MLTCEQLLDTRTDYLRKRFKDTFVVLGNNIGLVYVQDIGQDHTWIGKRIPTDKLHDLGFDSLRSERFNMPRVPLQKAAATTFGYVNTAGGVVCVTDQAERQWSWGVSGRRYRYTNSYSDSFTVNAQIAYALLYDKNPIYFNQLGLESPQIAISRSFMVNADGRVYTTLVQREAVGHCKIEGGLFLERAWPTFADDILNDIQELDVNVY